jgi:epidermal growth factor receptor substrate 15
MQPQYLPSGPSSFSRPPAKLKLTNQERGYYSNMFALANPSKDSNNLNSPDAVVFFKKSGLPVEKLSQIWRSAAKTSNDYLTKDEFYVALRLIAYAQNNMKYDEDAILFDLQVGLPNF